MTALARLAFCCSLALLPVHEAGAADAAPAPDPRLVEAEASIQEATQRIQQARYAEVRAPAERAIALIEATLGKDAPQLAEPMSLLGDAVRMTGDVAGGEAMQRKALALYENVGAQETAWYSQVLYRLGDVLRMRGKFSEALAVQQKYGALCLKLYGPQTSGLAVSLSAQAELHRSLGHTDTALPLHERAIAMSKATNGPRHAYTASLIQAQATTFAARGDYRTSVKGFEEALAIMDETLGNEHMWVAQVAQNLALELVHVGEFDRADKLYDRALAIDKKTLGPEHPFVAAVLANQGEVALSRNRLDLAETKLREAFTIAVKGYGEDHPEVATVAEHYARVLRETGRPHAARNLLLQTLQLRENLQGDAHPDLANSLVSLAQLALDQGNVEEGEQYAARALRLTEKAHGPDHPTVVPVLDLYARIDRAVGDTPQLLERRKKALQIHIATQGARHPDTASAQSNLAAALLPEDATQAVELMRTSLETMVRVFGREHVRTATAHGNLGAALGVLGDLTGARAELDTALALDRKLQGEVHPTVAADLLNLGAVDARLGHLGVAEQKLRAALAMYEESLGKDHPELASVLSPLADLLEAKGQLAEALALRARSSALQDAEMAHLLWTGDEDRKVMLLATLAADTADLLNQAIRLQPDNVEAGNLALQAVLRRHGRTVDVLADTLGVLRRRLAPEDQVAVDALAETRSRLSAYALRGPGDGDEAGWRHQVDKLKAEIRTNEAELSRRSAAYRDRMAPEATVRAVQAALAPKTALLEFVAWTPVAHVEDGRLEDRPMPARMAACVLRATGPARWFDLGELTELEAAVIAARRTLHKPDADPVPPLHALAAKVLHPLASALAGATHLRIAADGALLLVPFAALPQPDGSALAEKVTVSYVGSGRELLARGPKPPSRQPPLVLANPDFGAKAKGNTALATDLRSLAVDPLPGTAAEAKALATLWPGAKILTGRDAAESALTGVKGPKFLHIATHGYFQSAARSPGLAAIRAPLVRSGLLLAGFNRHRGGKEDGVLTALEAASLDLQGTELAVLSACNTGVGELRTGDGVQGLRRALAIAGAQTVVMSLWPVDDAATRLLMTEFYGQWQAGKGRAESLAAAQLAVRKQPGWQHPFYWAAFLAAGAE